MTVLCVNSTVVYADITAADAAEGGTDYGVPTRFEQTGTSTGSVGFSVGDYPSLFIYTATVGEETTGVITVGAQCTGLISMATTGTISNLRTDSISLKFAGNVGTVLDSLVMDGFGSSDVLEFQSNLAYTFNNLLIHNVSEGFRSTSTNNNAIATNCTVVDASGFGVLRPRAVDCVSLNTGSAAYLQEGASSSNYWADDGTGSDAITEGTPTDIFEDYAGGDYRIKASSSPGLANAGAFINSGGGGITLSVTEVLNPFSDSSTVNVVNKISLAVTETLSAFTESSVINVSAAVSIEATVTEVLNPFSDSSVIAIVEAGNVALNVTETLSPFSDSSALNISANVNLNITEVLNSFLDGSNVTIAKDITIQVTEVLASFIDNSFVRMPTSWTDKTPASTNYTIKPPVNTIWIDKG